MVLEKINKANDVKKLKEDELGLLAYEIRKRILEVANKRGGHLASNLGAVELTIAIHRVLDMNKDKLIFDVGHQAYTHKILTGRKDELFHMGELGGISSFPRMDESKYDSFSVGHASTSLSVGLGYAVAKKLNNTDETIVAVVGDGALTGGMIYEALNNFAKLNTNFIVILNDNNMSIGKNVGGIAEILASIRLNDKYINLKKDVKRNLNKLSYGEKMISTISKLKTKLKAAIIPGMFFENMNLTYLGPVDGHNISKLSEVISEAKKYNRGVIIHTITNKGYGFSKAMKSPNKYHSISSLDVSKSSRSYTNVFSDKLIELAKKDDDIVAITAAMLEGTGLESFKEVFPDRTFDVGIAEEHGVTFAAGLAAAGKKPYVAIYSTFLQRAYDQLIHDVGLNDLNVTFILDRAGFIERDGRTHQGIYDLSYLATVPNMCILAPRNANTLERALDFTASYTHPCSIRYPKMNVKYDENYDKDIVYGKGELLNEPDDKRLLIIPVGRCYETAVKIKSELDKNGIGVGIFDPVFIKPIDIEVIMSLGNEYERIITIEEGISNGGFYERLLSMLHERGFDTSKIRGFSLDTSLDYDKGNLDDLRCLSGIDEVNIIRKMYSLFGVK